MVPSYSKHFPASRGSRILPFGFLLHHPDREYHGFQYADWLFDGDDLVFLSRTAYDDERTGANNFHNSNYLTFHRIEAFRDALTEQIEDR